MNSPSRAISNLVACRVKYLTGVVYLSSNFTDVCRKEYTVVAGCHLPAPMGCYFNEKETPSSKGRTKNIVYAKSIFENKEKLTTRGIDIVKNQEYK